MRAALEGGQLSGDGPYTARCRALLEEELGVRRALLTGSGTHALEMAALLLNFGPGDEVILPSFTFVSAANAFVLRGARPVFADIREDTLNIDEERLPGLVTDRTKAIVPVHYGGVGCDMDAIMVLARERRVAVVEDNAHGVFGRYKGKRLGSFGCLAALSFHETKNFICGEGGALLINDPDLIARAEIIREKGTNRAQFLNGQVDKYSWVDVGSSYLSGELAAAFLLAQLESSAAILRKRKALWERYHAALCGWAARSEARRPSAPEDCVQTHHIYYLIMPSKAARDALIRHLDARNIHSVFHYVPLHSSPMGRELGGAAAACPVAAKVSDRMLRLPMFIDLDASSQNRVIEAVEEFRV